MQASAEHVQYQLPNEHSRVGFLLEAIQCSDAGLQAAMASIKTDNGPEVTEFRQPLQVQSHLEVPRILVQLGHIQRT